MNGDFSVFLSARIFFKISTFVIRSKEKNFGTKIACTMENRFLEDVTNQIFTSKS